IGAKFSNLQIFKSLHLLPAIGSHKVGLHAHNLLQYPQNQSIHYLSALPPIMRNAITSVLRRFQNWSLLFVLLLSFAVKAQDTGFTLSVTATDETCLGNGTLTFHLENTI